MPQPNQLLRNARESTPSRRRPGSHMSRNELAEAVALWLATHDDKGRDAAFDSNHLGKIERGIIGRPRPHYVAALCAVLGATEAELGFDAGSALPTPMPRSIEAWELTDALTRSTISAATIEQLDRAVQEHAASYPSTPPRTLHTSITNQLTHLKEALRHPQPLRIRQRCVALLGTLCGLAGNLWLDLGHYGRAAEFFHAGELAGHEAEDQDLMAWLLATRSIGLYFAGHYGAATPTARACRQRRHGAVHRAPASLGCRLGRTSGRRCRRPQRSLAALDRAHHHINAMTEPAAGTDFFDAPRLDGVAGSAHLLMRDTKRAIPLLSRALARRAAEDTKGRALLTLDLAQCHIRTEPEEAARLAVAALNAAHGTMVEPIATRAQDVRAQLNPWAGLPPVRELGDRLAGLSREL